MSDIAAMLAYEPVSALRVARQPSARPSSRGKSGAVDRALGTGPSKREAVPSGKGKAAGAASKGSATKAPNRAGSRGASSGGPARQARENSAKKVAGGAKGGGSAKPAVKAVTPKPPPAKSATNAPQVKVAAKKAGSKGSIVKANTKGKNNAASRAAGRVGGVSLKLCVAAFRQTCQTAEYCFIFPERVLLIVG